MIKNDIGRQTDRSNIKESQFSLYIKEKEEAISILPQKGFYRLFFLLEGVCQITRGTKQIHSISSGQFILLPANKEIEILVKEKSTLLILLSYNLLLATERAREEKESKQKLHVFHLSPAMEMCCRFILLICKEEKMPKEWEELKKRELSLLLKHDYTNRQLSDLFSPVALDKSGFRQKVKQYILQTSSITELHTLSGMKRSTFEKRFRKEFGNSPYKWILQKKSIEVKQSLLDSSLSIEEVRIKHGFNSASHFVRFCHRQLGMAPSALRKEFKRGINDTNEIW